MNGIASRLTRFGLLVAAALVVWSAHATAADAPRYNVIVILTDDQGWGDLSLHGNTNLRTPNIDSLAQRGAQFERFFVCPVCSPTRAEYLTGRYHVRGGVHSTSAGGERLDIDERTIAQVFKQAGYATGAFGKWHNGGQYPYHPLGRGFDEFYGFCSGHWGDYFSPPLEHNNQRIRGNGFLIDDITDRAMAFIDQHRHEPFFCYLPINTPHTPAQVPDRFYARFAHAELPMRAAPVGKQTEDLQMTRAVMAMVENIDWNIGRLLERLDQLQLADRTVIVYFHDNGPNSLRWNGGMRGRKGSTDEGGVRSPLLVRAPGLIPPGTRVTQIAGAIDLLPTLADLCNVKIGEGKPLDGLSLAPWLRGEKTAPIERMIFNHWAGKTSVRTQTHRLDMAGKLYDLTNDPGQQRELNAEQPELVSRLSQAVEQWRNTVLVELGKDERGCPVGHRAMPTAYLPAGEGIEHGSIRRSNKAPNCSYFTHWTSTDDRITWDLDIAEAGRYSATIYYTCAAKGVGSELELSVGDARATVTLSQINDPPLVGAEHDRASRGTESYLRDFKPLKVGELKLSPGRGMLSIRATKLTAAEAIEVNAVELTLLE